jgi:serine/threonine-protein kinase RsbW
MNKVLETIKLSLPPNPAYISSARLTASSIGGRMNFDVEAVEDIKTAVSEACAFFIKKTPCNNNEDLIINFIIGEDQLSITHSLATNINISLIEEDLSILAIKALIDTFSLDFTNGTLTMEITKFNKKKSFDI